MRRADALAWMAERLFESGDAPALASDRHEIVVHVEAEVLADGRAGRCEIEHGTAIAAETARRLCCDAGIIPVVDGANGEPLSVGRRTRSIPPAIRRALLSRPRKRNCNLMIYRDYSSEALEQLKNVARLPITHSHVAAMPDVHYGRGATVGSVIATRGAPDG